MNIPVLIVGLLLGVVPLGLDAQESSRWGRVSVIRMPYTGARNVAERSGNPGDLYRHGITDSIRALGFALAGVLQRQGGR